MEPAMRRESIQMDRESKRTSGRKVLAMILLLVASLLVLDGVIRLLESRVSGNLGHVARMPSIIQEARQSHRPAVLLLGNSLTNNGMDASLIEARLGSVAVAKVTPDATDLWDWQCILRHQVVSAGTGSIRTVVVGTAWHLLSDQAAVDPSRLGALFCRFSDLARPSSIGLQDFAAIGEFVVARLSRPYALRDTLRNRLFEATIPHYRRFAAESNAATAGDTGKHSPPQQFTYEHLAVLVEHLRQAGAGLTVVAMPIPEKYEIDAGLLQLVAEGKLELLDYRKLPGVGLPSFIDSMHLGAEGRSILSVRLAADIAPITSLRP
jgi:hypothetical protein